MLIFVIYFYKSIDSPLTILYNEFSMTQEGVKMKKIIVGVIWAAVFLCCLCGCTGELPANPVIHVNESVIEIDTDELDVSAAFTTENDRGYVLIISGTGGISVNGTHVHFPARGKYVIRISLYHGGIEAMFETLAVHVRLNADEEGQEPEPPEPIVLGAPQITLNQGTLSWTAVERADCYEVLLSGAVEAVTQGLQYTIPNKVNGTYVYTVRAKCGDVIGSQSGDVTYIADTQPKTLTAPVLKTVGNRVFWSEVEHAVSYVVYVNDVSTEIAQCEYILSEVGFYRVSVKSVGDGKRFLTSDRSEQIEMRIVDTEAPKLIVEKSKFTATVFDVFHFYDEWRISTADNASRAVRVDVAGGGKHCIVDGKNMSFDTDGIFNLTLTAVDESGNVSEECRITITVLKKEIATPEVDAAAAHGGWKITWQAVDDATRYRVYIDGKLEAITESGSYLLTDRAEGEYRVAVTAETDDSRYLTSTLSSEIRVRFDAVQPQRPSPPTLILKDNHVAWDAIDGADGYNVYVNGSFVERTEGCAWQIATTAVGCYTVEVSTVSQGLESVLSAAVVVVVLDTLPPMITCGTAEITVEIGILQGTPLPFSIDVVSAFSVKVQDDTDASVSIRLSQTDAAVEGLNLVVSAVRVYSVTLSATDKAGNTSSVVLTINVVRAAPIRLGTPSVMLADSLITWQNVPHAAEYEILVNGAHYARTTACTFSLALTAVGSYQINVRAVSDSENFIDGDCSATLQFVVADQQAPTISIGRRELEYAVKQLPYELNAVMQFSITAVDAVSEAKITLQCVDGNAAVDGLTMVFSAFGSYVITVRAWDDTGNVSEVLLTFTLTKASSPDLSDITNAQNSTCTIETETENTHSGGEALRCSGFLNGIKRMIIGIGDIQDFTVDLRILEFYVYFGEDPKPLNLYLSSGTVRSSLKIETAAVDDGGGWYRVRVKISDFIRTDESSAGVCCDSIMIIYKSASASDYLLLDDMTLV